MALSQETVNGLIDLATSDPDFVKDLAEDPETAVESRGLELQPGELDKLHSLMSSSSGEDDANVERLEARISHSLVGHDELSRLLLIEHFLRSAGAEEE